MNHQSTTRKHKEGAQVISIVLDVDTDKNIIDLSERLVEVPKSKSLPTGTQKAIVELSKDNYLISTLKNFRDIICLTVMHSLNQSNTDEVYSKYSVGDEIEVKILSE